MSNSAVALDAFMYRSAPLCEGRPNGCPNGIAPPGFDPRPCARGDQLAAVAMTLN